jgi:hypothetical protein
MKKTLALFALLTSMALQTNYTYSGNHSLPSTSLRVIGLALAGAGITYLSITTLKNVIDKILEENPTINNEETLRAKYITALRYTFGISASVAGVLIGLYTLSNVDNSEFLIRLY